MLPQEEMDLNESHQASSILDEMIEQMQREQDGHEDGPSVADVAAAAAMPPPVGIPGPRPATPSRGKSFALYFLKATV